MGLHTGPPSGSASFWEPLRWVKLAEIARELQLLSILLAGATEGLEEILPDKVTDALRQCLGRLGCLNRTQARRLNATDPFTLGPGPRPSRLSPLPSQLIIFAPLAA